MKNLENSVLLLARIMMPILFIVAGYGKLGDAYAGLNNICKRWVFPAFYFP